MRVVKQSRYIGLAKTNGELDLERLEPMVRDMHGDLVSIFTALQKRISFGDGTDGHSENVSGAFVVYVSNGVADIEDTVAHGLGVAPVGYIVVKQDKGSNVYDSGTAWDSTNLYLKQTGTTVATTLFLLK